MSNTIGNISRLVPGLQTEIGQNKNANSDDKANFTEIFGNMLNSVNGLQMDAGKAQEMLATGDAAEIHEVMLAAEKAGVAMDLLLEIRNKLVDAYQTMMRMPM